MSTTNLAAVDFGGAVTDGFRTIATFIPKLIGFLLILIIGYFPNPSTHPATLWQLTERYWG